MVNFHNDTFCKSSVYSKLYQYVEPFAENKHSYKCSAITDSDWLYFGMGRVLSKSRSGREFFQDLFTHSDCEIEIARTTFQSNLQSKRRLKFVTELLNNYLAQRAQEAFQSKAGNLPESLNGYHVYAADGHWHAASVHEELIEEKRYPTGHLFCINLRNQDVNHLIHSELTKVNKEGKKIKNKKPHDMALLKHMEKDDIQQLRQHAKKGQKVIYVWDPAGLDAHFWGKCKQTHGIYFVSTTKDNMTKEVEGNIPIESENEENVGVLKDQLISVTGRQLRMVTYYDHELDKTFEFLTNLPPSISPGAIAQLYRMRWDIEKVFDEFKNKFNEKKSWGKHSTAKQMQGKLMALAYSLLRRLQNEIEQQDGLFDIEEKERKKERWKNVAKFYKLKGKAIPALYEKLQRSTQIGVKFIRWVRGTYFRLNKWRNALRLLEKAYHSK